MMLSGACPRCKSRKIGYLENVMQRTEAIVESRSVIGHCPAPLGIARTET